MRRALLLWSFPVLILLLSLPVIFAFFQSGYPATHDGMSVIIRTADMVRLIKDGQFPPRYSGYLNHDYGYPLFNFAYPFPYYVSAVLQFFRLGLINSAKLLFIISVPLSALAMYFAAAKLWRSSWAGFIAAIFYAYLPYRIVNLYVRGSIGESWGTVFYPLLVWLFLNFLEKKKYPFLVVATAVTLAILIPTHNIAALYAFPLAGILLLTGVVLKRNKETLLFGLSLAIGFGLSAYFWLPAVFEKSYVRMSQIPIANRNLYFLKLPDLWVPKWGYGVPDAPDGFGYQLGWFLLLALVPTIIILGKDLIKKSSWAKTEIVLASLLLLLALAESFFLFPISSTLWKLIPILKDIDYPWSLLGPIGFSASLLSGVLARNRISRVLALLLVAAGIAVVLPHARPRSYLTFSDSFYQTNDGTTTSSSEFMPLWVKDWPKSRPTKKISITSGNGNVSLKFSTSKSLAADVSLSSPGQVRINTIYYPGWSVKVDNNVVPINYENPEGVMQINIPLGNHQIEAGFGETPLRLASDLISLTSLFLLGLIALRSHAHLRL